ncbi:MAG: DUF1801 domain-containing protein [Flavobacteriales bacterium]|nr:DUF1801 domain-containing protein [Flavobacteriales bacterium]
MKIVADSVEEYLEALPEDRRVCIQHLRDLIKGIWPQAVEDLADGMPTFHLHGRPFCSVGSQKNFMAFYLVPYDMLVAFRKDLKAYDHGRSCIRFRRLEVSDLLLFEKIVKYAGSRFSESEHFGQGNGRST